MNALETFTVVNKYVSIILEDTIALVVLDTD